MLFSVLLFRSRGGMAYGQANQRDGSNQTINIPASQTTKHEQSPEGCFLSLHHQSTARLPHRIAILTHRSLSFTFLPRVTLSESLPS